MLDKVFFRSGIVGHYKQIESEKKDFYNKYIKKLRLVIADGEDGRYFKIEVGK